MPAKPLFSRHSARGCSSPTKSLSEYFTVIRRWDTDLPNKQIEPSAVSRSEQASVVDYSPRGSLIYLQNPLIQLPIHFKCQMSPSKLVQQQSYFTEKKHPLGMSKRPRYNEVTDLRMPHGSPCSRLRE